MPQSAHPEAIQSFTSCFGAGCFHFAPRDLIQPFDAFKFSKDIRRSLESVPMISNVNLNGFQAMRGFPPYHAVDIFQGPGLGFHPAPSELAFDIYVPEHIQEKMLHGFSRTNSERFHVRIFYTYAFAATIVEPIAAFTDDPSDAVIVVRKCLEEYFSNIPDSVVNFQSLGPSPFHADFFIRSEAGEVDEVKCRIMHRRGYDRITYTVTCTNESKCRGARDVVFKHVVEELGGFYHIVQVGNRLRDEWAQIEEGLDSIGENALRRKFISIPWLSLRNSGDLEAMYFGLYKIRLEKARAARFLEDHRKSLRDEGIEQSLQEYVAREFAELPETELQQAKTMLDLLEQRRAAYSQNVSVLMAAVVGAAIGSGLVLAFNP